MKKKLFNLLGFRNQSTAFDGEFSVEVINENVLNIIWVNKEKATVITNVKNKAFVITEEKDGMKKVYICKKDL